MASSVQHQSTMCRAMLAYLTTLVSTLNFVMSVEVSFYPHFRRYFKLYNEEGSLSDIQEAETQMLNVMSNELKYVFGNNC